MFDCSSYFLFTVNLILFKVMVADAGYALNSHRDIILQKLLPIDNTK